MAPFSAFWGSSMPKHLIKYALSRIDLLDHDTIDLDNLELAWGMNTQVEFKDVGIRTDKLHSLLALPDNFSILRAKALTLRLNVPIDLYSSPISIQVNGVQVQVKVASQEKAPRKAPAKQHGETGDEVMPNTVDLAQSFLETQPMADKKNLEDAIAAEAKDLGASMASDSEDEDDLAYGTGQALTLPTFIADFFRGIADRIQVQIQNIAFQLDVEVPAGADSHIPDLVTFELNLESIDVEGVTASPRVLGSEDRQKMVSWEGKRHISLNNVRAFLISEANVFTMFSRSSSMPSSVSTRSPVLTERSPPSRTSSDLAQSIAEATDDSIYDPAPDPLQDSEDAFNIPYDFNELGSDPEDEQALSSPSTPRASVYQPFRYDGPPAQSEVMDRTEAWSSTEGGSRSEPGPPHINAPETLSDSTMTDPPSQPVSEPPSDESTPGPDELASSHVFTHEEAESMYMSALSQMNTSSGMPGGWESNGSPTDDAVTAAGRPRSSNPQDGGQTSVSAGDTRLHPENAQPEEVATHGSTRSSPKPEENQTGIAEERPPQDEAATPRGPTRLVKEIVSLASISVYIPSNHKHLAIPMEASEHMGALMGQSMVPNMPGTFSVHAASLNADISPPKTDSKAPDAEHQIDSSIEVELSPLRLQFDTSIGFLLAKVVGVLLDAVKSTPNSPAPPTAAQATENNASKMPDIKVHAQSINMDFLEKLPGVSDTTGRMFGSSHVPLDAQVLLTTGLSGLKIAVSNEKGDWTTDVDLKAFTFGYQDEPIISFNPGNHMVASVRDAFPSPGNDVSMQLKQTGAVTTCNIKTLPLVLRLDLLKLDDTFSWFGGLSSFINMGSSMTSNASSPAKSSAAVKQPQRKGVRFEGDATPCDPVKLKVDLRINSFHMDLLGRDSSVVLQSSAIKFVVRDSSVGLGISMVRLEGPFKPGQTAPIAVSMKGLRLEYQLTPQTRDLERLLGLITPSKFKFDENYDEIMVDPLLRQRRKGPVLRINLESVLLDVKNLAHLDCLPSLGEDLARLATVTKYLPEDDRPGLLTFVKVSKLESAVAFGGRLGTFQGKTKDLEIAHISIPMLVAFAVGNVSILRNKTEELVSHSGTGPREPSIAGWPVVTARYIGNEIDPVIKIKLRDIRLEYRVPTIMDFLNLSEDATPEDFENAMAQSVANLGDQAHAAMIGKGKTPIRTASADSSTIKQTKVDITFMDCLVGLNPLRLPSRMVLVLTDARLAVHLPQNDSMKVVLDISRAGIVLVNDVAVLGKPDDSRSRKRRTSDATSPQTTQLCEDGYVSILYTSAAQINVDIVGVESRERYVTVKAKDNLVVLETCADSTQTLIAVANSLAPPTPPSKQVKFRTNVPLVQNLMASISGEAFGKAEGDYDFETDFGHNPEFLDDASSEMPSGTDSPLDIQSQYLGDEGEDVLFDAGGSQYSDRTTTRDTNDDGVLLSIDDIGGRRDETLDVISDSGSEISIKEHYFGKHPSTEGATNTWNSARNAYETTDIKKAQRSPFKINVEEVHLIWNLYDGYDWAKTRDALTKAVEEAEARAFARQNQDVLARRKTSATADDFYDEEDGTEVGDVLFNSIYIAIPSSKNPQDLTIAINQQLGDNGTETESIATTNVTAATARVAAGYNPSGSKARKLRLNRSKRHKISFELQGVFADVVTFPPRSGETQSVVDIRVRNLDIFDNISTSTWKKFATYDRDAGEREMDTHMIHLELLNVKPVQDLAASELVIKVNVLPLRLHVDQDALEFITRFFEFKDSSVPIHASESDVPFIQRIEVASIPVQLDFKPKRVDYLALRSGRTSEFMHFVVLDQANLVLRHIIMYGISGFDRMGNTLNELWTADVKSGQLPGVLAGLAPARSLVNVGAGFRDLVEIPIKEYRRDGRIIRSVRKGATAFVKKTGTEVIKLGAKLAIGTQNILQGAEEIFVNKNQEQYTGWDSDEADDDNEKKQISLYANQPRNLTQGFTRAYSSLSRDLSVARDAIIAIPTDVAQSRNAAGAAKAILEKAPVLIFRPTIGATKAIGQTLLGATNTIDSENQRRVNEKYKH